MDWTLRKAVPADAARVGELFSEMLQSVYGTGDAQGYAAGGLDKFFAGGEDWICLAEAGGETVGYLAIEVYRAPRTYVYLDDLAVTARFRGRGIGTTLLREAEKYAGRIGVPTLLLHVEKTNAAARRLYERLGYRAFRDDGSRWLMRADTRG